ncbi:MAG: arginase [Planctomycetes bacterium]|nr:arginase [Planctomycetota bacterium]MBI3846578.1 arginase [Planctomycetota bacterium]
MQPSISVLGVPIDLGFGRRGVDMGPSAFRIAGVLERVAALGFHVQDLGDVFCPNPEIIPVGDPKLKYAEEILRLCETTAELVVDILGRGSFPLFLGGDHSMAIGTFAGLAEHYRDKHQTMGVVWLDAHGDMNTPQTTPSGNVHGMPLAISLGMGADSFVKMRGFAPKLIADKVALIGVRDLDPGERRNITESGVHVFTMNEVDRRGFSSVMEEALSIATNGTQALHVSFDMDVVDPLLAPGVGTPVRGGLSYREAHLAMELIAESKRLTSLEVVEANPILDVKNSTADLGVELILSALGKRII